MDKIKALKGLYSLFEKSSFEISLNMVQPKKVVFLKYNQKRLYS